jgi:hypothetical protein
MKPWQFLAVSVLGGLCLVISVTAVLLTKSNQRLQQDVQNKQQQLSSGILGPQGQQIASAILQEMVAVAATNGAMRQMLARHGQNVPVAPQAVSVSLAVSNAIPVPPAATNAAIVPQPATNAPSRAAEPSAEEKQ